MNLPENLKQRYSRESRTVFEAQRAAQEIAFGPIVFQVSRTMLEFGIFKLLNDNPKGLTMEQIIVKSKLSDYAVKVLMEASLTIGTVLIKDDLFFISKTGWYLLNDPMTNANLNFVQDVNYLGFFNLEKSLTDGKPEGLKIFGNWPTIYQGLSQLPADVQKSWFEFDHFYSDHNFSQALDIILKNNPKTILDIGGNTGRFAVQCVARSKDISVTVMDLPQQLELMANAIEAVEGRNRINQHPCDVLNENSEFPQPHDVVWMSQFLDCFSKEQILQILQKAKNSVAPQGRLYIMETFWDRQKYETAAYCLTLTSLYFTAMANGNSKMYHSDDFLEIVKQAGLTVSNIYEMEYGHSLVECII